MKVLLNSLQMQRLGEALRLMPTPPGKLPFQLIQKSYSEKPIVYINAVNSGNATVIVTNVTKNYFEAEIIPSLDYSIQIKWLVLIADKNDSNKLHIIESSKETMLEGGSGR